MAGLTFSLNFEQPMDMYQNISVRDRPGCGITLSLASVCAIFLRVLFSSLRSVPGTVRVMISSGGTHTHTT